MRVSEAGFGAWAIGGSAYGRVDRSTSLSALSRAEELGCNFVDTAAVYGDSEDVLGDFLDGRRAKWLVSTKYSAQPEGVIATVESQLRRLRTDVIDFYQIHWAPRSDEQGLYDAIYRLKRDGKVRAVGVSLKTALDIDYVLRNTAIDGFQVPCNLLQPYPLVARLEEIRRRGLAVIVRSALREGFLTGKFSRGKRFSDPQDQRSKWPPEEVDRTIDNVEQFRFLEREAGSLAVAAARYPLSFPETSTVILGTKTPEQADVNFGLVSQAVLSAKALSRIGDVQARIGARSRVRETIDRIRGATGF